MSKKPIFFLILLFFCSIANASTSDDLILGCFSSLLRTHKNDSFNEKFEVISKNPFAGFSKNIYWAGFCSGAIEPTRQNAFSDLKNSPKLKNHKLIYECTFELKKNWDEEEFIMYMNIKKRAFLKKYPHLKNHSDPRHIIYEMVMSYISYKCLT